MGANVDGIADTELRPQVPFEKTSASLFNATSEHKHPATAFKLSKPPLDAEDRIIYLRALASPFRDGNVAGGPSRLRENWPKTLN